MPEIPVSERERLGSKVTIKAFLVATSRLLKALSKTSLPNFMMLNTQGKDILFFWGVVGGAKEQKII